LKSPWLWFDSTAAVIIDELIADDHRKASEMTVANDFADAAATDPNMLKWMVGSPPPPSKLIRFQDGSYYRFP
jgi:hypothetical protein